MIHIPHLAPCLLIVALLVPQWIQAEPQPAPEAAWVEAMTKVHADFRGQKGTFATFGDSITVSLAFWALLRNQRQHMRPEAEAAFQRVNRYMKPECWDKWRGPAFGNDGGRTIVWADKNVQQWLKQHQPETVLVMFGTNDLTSVPLEDYERLLRRVVDACTSNGSVVILSTIPPRHGLLERSRQLADIVRRVARDRKVPLCDYQAECLRRRPDDWDGAAAKFKDYKDYDVPTLIARDGVHPSFPKKYQGDYSEEGLRSSGYGLRSFVTMMTYAEVIRRVLERAKPPAK